MLFIFRNLRVYRKIHSANGETTTHASSAAKRTEQIVHSYTKDTNYVRKTRCSTSPLPVRIWNERNDRTNDRYLITLAHRSKKTREVLVEVEE